MVIPHVRYSSQEATICVHSWLGALPWKILTLYTERLIPFFDISLLACVWLEYFEVWGSPVFCVCGIWNLKCVNSESKRAAGCVQRGHVRREHEERLRLRGRGRNLVCGKSCNPNPSLKHLCGSFYDIWASTITVRAPVLKFVVSKLHFIPFLRTFCMFVFAAPLNTSFSSWVSQFALDLQSFREDEK